MLIRKPITKDGSKPNLLRACLTSSIDDVNGCVRDLTRLPRGLTLTRLSPEQRQAIFGSSYPQQTLDVVIQADALDQTPGIVSTTKVTGDEMRGLAAKSGSLRKVEQACGRTRLAINDSLLVLNTHLFEVGQRAENFREEQLAREDLTEEQKEDIRQEYAEVDALREEERQLLARQKARLGNMTGKLTDEAAALGDDALVQDVLDRIGNDMQVDPETEEAAAQAFQAQKMRQAAAQATQQADARKNKRTRKSGG